MNSKSIIRAVKHYVFGLLASSWNGGISAVAGILGIGVANVSGIPDVHVLNGSEMASVFAGAFLLHAVMWLKTHPVPTEFHDTNPPISKP